MIPKKIHQIWIGPDKPPYDILDTWVAHHPAWEYKLWRDEDVADLDLINQRLYDELVGQSLYSGASDILRAELLFQFGGVYIDADAYCLHPLDGAPFLEAQFWIAEEYRHHETFLLNPCCMGAESHSPVVRDYLDSLHAVTHEHVPAGGSWTLTGPTRWTHLLRGREDITIVDPGHFFSHGVHLDPVPDPDGVRYADHKFGAFIGKSSSADGTKSNAVPWCSMIVPFVDVEEERTRVWNWLETYWQHRLPYVEMILQPGPVANFSKTKVLNEGIERARGSVIIAMDADTLCAKQQMERAIHIAKGGGWALPYDKMWRLSMKDTEIILDSDPWLFEPKLNTNFCQEQPHATRWGAMCAVYPKAAWKRIGGWDESFVGWGGEDSSMRVSLDTMWCPRTPVRGPIFHMEHTRPGAGRGSRGDLRRWPGQEAMMPNWDRLQPYWDAEGDPEALEAVIRNVRETGDTDPR